MSDIITSIKRRVVDKQTRKLPRGIPAGITITSFNKAKHVKKPWGFELWLAAGGEVPYALKVLYLKKGTKTSLQYHERKIEHNCVLAGRVRFHYEDVKTKKIHGVVVSAGTVIQVKPPAVHRVEALTDVLLVEASTDHLDDVVRIDDDYSRPDGFIKAEHA